MQANVHWNGHVTLGVILKLRYVQILSRASRYYWRVLNINFNLHVVGNDWNELCCEIQVKIIVHFLYARKIQILIVYVNDSWNILYIDIKNNKRKPQKINKYLNYNISVKKLQKRSILKISWKWISHLKNVFQSRFETTKT